MGACTWITLKIGSSRYAEKDGLDFEEEIGAVARPKDHTVSFPVKQTFQK